MATKNIKGGKTLRKAVPESISGGGEGPSYARPPVDEVVCGVRFEVLQNFKLPHHGLLWTKFKSTYPKIEHVAPLALGGGLSIDLASGAPLPRLWFVNERDDELVQFQLDQLYFNWRRRESEYPRYKNIFPKFQSAKQQLDDLLGEIGLPPIVIVERELTYINRIVQGEGWESLTDLPKVISSFRFDKSDLKFLPPPARMAWNLRFEFPDGKGFLDVKVSQGSRRKDNRPTLVLQLSAKARSTSNEWKEQKEWFDLAHKWIVNGFADMTAAGIQKDVWGREDVA